MAEEQDHLFQPKTFKEKVLCHTPDILFVMLIVAVGLSIASARKNGYIQSNNTQQSLKHEQVNTVLSNDSINQKVR